MMASVFVKLKLPTISWVDIVVIILGFKNFLVQTLKSVILLTDYGKHDSLGDLLSFSKGPRLTSSVSRACQLI